MSGSQPVPDEFVHLVPIFETQDILAALGLRHLPNSAGTPWERDDRQAFESAATALFAVVAHGPSVPLSVHHAMKGAVAFARDRIVRRHPNWWPDPYRTNLTAPIGWGAAHLLQSVSGRTDIPTELQTQAIRIITQAIDACQMFVTTPNEQQREAMKRCRDAARSLEHLDHIVRQVDRPFPAIEFPTKAWASIRDARKC